MSNSDELKKLAGYRACELIQDGQTVGLGTGSTATHLVNRLAERIHQENLHVQAVSTSWSTTLQCRRLGIPLLDLGEVSHLDIAIDGADEIDCARNLIKGRGAAHLLEKIVAAMADRYVIVADETKKVALLGEKFAVPLEVLPSAIGLVTSKVSALGGQVVVRMGAPGKDGPVISDSGNLIVDAKFLGIPNPPELARALESIPGMLGHGLFVAMATHVILATANGLVEF
jgi:ribose 5-phosphate isomerase A